MIYNIEKKFVEKILNSSTLRRRGVVNIHRFNTNNSGDLKSAPYLYFKQLNDFPKLDIIGYLSYNFLNTIKWLKSVNQNDIVLGGGGLFDRFSFDHSISLINFLLKKGRKIVLWGVGYNNSGFYVTNKFFDQIKNFKLIGLRDYGVKNTTWVPCVSCMHQIFDKKYHEKFEIGIIEHENSKIIKDNLIQYPYILNNSLFEDIIYFIGSVNTLITNSYHAMYWGMLMKKKVIVIPNSSKMFGFKYKVPICFDIKDYKTYLKKTNVYDELLEECRTINKKFSIKVFDYLNLS